MSTFNIDEIQGGTVYDSEGDKVGGVGQLYLDDASGEPNFVTVKTGLLGGKESFVPLEGADVRGGEIHVPYTKDFIKEAPQIAEDGHIEPSEEDEIYRYYQVGGAGTSDAGTADAGQTDRSGLATAGAAGGAAGAAGVAGGRGDADGHAGAGGDGGADGQAGAIGSDGHAGAGGDGGADGQAGAVGSDGHAGLGGDGGADGQAGAVGSDGHAGLGGDGGADGGAQTGAGFAAAAPAGDAGEGVVVHEEQVNVGTQRVETGRVRLRKHVVTENRTVEVPVQREEVELVREPIADGERGGTLSEGETEVTLSEERPVVDKEVVATERVHLDKRTVQETQQVQADVGREEVEIVRDGGEDRSGWSDADYESRGYTRDDKGGGWLDRDGRKA